MSAPSPEAPRPLRFVWFVESVVADWDNPAATTTRAVVRSLVQAGHEVLVLEARGNAPTIGMLRARGSEALRAYARHWADVHYRTYDLPRRGGLEAQVWYGQLVAIADAAIMQDRAPELLRSLFRDFDSWSQVAVHQQTGPDSDPLAANAALRLTPIGEGDGMPFGPAAIPAGDLASGQRSGTAVVHYGGPGLEAAIATAGENTVVLAAGSGGSAHLPWEPEAALSARYTTTSHVVVIDDDHVPLAMARPLLAAAAGAEVTWQRGDAPAQPVLFSAANDAHNHAARLEAAVRLRLADQRARYREERMRRS